MEPNEPAPQHLQADGDKRTSSSASTDGPAPLRIMTFNIRCETKEPDPQDNWSVRREAVAKFLHASGADLIGLQEVRPQQLEFLVAMMAEHGYSHVAVGRDADGGGEASPIFFKSNRFELEREHTCWLSSTPTVPGSKLKGAKCPRIVTCAALRERSGQQVFAFCAHLDHNGMAKGKLTGALPVQKAQAEIIAQTVDAFCGDAAGPRIIAGDFNSWRSAGAPPVLLTAGYVDASLCDGKANDQPTFVGFRSGSVFRRAVEGAISEHIDWIFVKNGFHLSDYTVSPSQYVTKDDQLRSLSDHLAVCVTLHMNDSSN